MYRNIPRPRCTKTFGPHEWLRWSAGCTAAGLLRPAAGHLDIDPEWFAPSVWGSQARVEHEEHIA